MKKNGGEKMGMIEGRVEMGGKWEVGKSGSG